MKELILDYKRWRCGYMGKDENCRLGDRTRMTMLQSDLGRKIPLEHDRCCLGQFILQLRSDFTEEKIKDIADPYQFGMVIELLTYDNDGFIKNSEFSQEAIDINDNEYTTIVEKIKLLKELCLKHDYKLKVINLPDSLK